MILRIHAAWLLVLTFCGAASANCVVGVPHPTFYVGSDDKCQYATIQQAIAAVPSPTSCAPNIVIAAEHPWSEHLSIDNRSLTLIGSTSNCGTISNGGIPGAARTAVTGPVLTINGSGNTATSVISITGASTVTIQNIEITGGNVAGASALGGGISFTGSGSLLLDASTVDGNQAAFGAGIGIDPASGSVSLRLQDNTQISGNTASDTGGGIYFSGSGTASLDSSSVDNNEAGYGGGIDMSPTGTAALTLGASTLITNNTAGHSGGGIRLEGSTRMYMLVGGSTISFNDAQLDYGGGLEIIGPARADIGSSGAVLVGAVSFNSAPYGGGIAILGGDAGDAAARVFTTDAAQPVLISNNTASGQGGAFYVAVPDDSSNSSELCAYNFRIDSNTAPDGAAIYTLSNSNAANNLVVSLNPADDCGPESPASLGATGCARGVPCDEVSDNDAVDGGGNPSGAIVTIARLGELNVERTQMRTNYGTFLLMSFGDTGAYLRGCLLASNHTASELIHDETVGQIVNCTVADNTIDNGYVIRAYQHLVLTDSIIEQPANSTLDYTQSSCDISGCVLDASYLMASDIASLPASSNILAITPGDPLFVDAAHGDYRLTAYLQNGSLRASRAIDFAPTEVGDAEHDFAGNTYGQDVPAVPDLYGSRDLGAHEAQPILDRVFASGFGDPVSLVKL